MSDSPKYQYGHQTFFSNQQGLGLSTFKAKEAMVEQLAQRVTDWLNQHAEGLEVIKLDYECEEGAQVHAILWYRRDVSKVPPVPQGN